MLAICSLALAAHALWLPTKAALAQQLLREAWSESRHPGRAHRPWPWADSLPVARLVQARLGVDQIVVSGDGGRALTFAPGWAESSARPGAAGTVVISGHRDSHFAWMRDLQLGDLVELEGPRRRRRYRVSALDVVDSRQHHLSTAARGDRLLLVTCWPFDALAARGPLRYVATLETAP